MNNLFRLRFLVRPYLRYFLGAMITLLLVTALQLVVPQVIQQVIDVGLARREISFLIYAALVILGIGILRAALAFVQRYLSEYISMNVAYDLRNKLYDHIQHLSFSFYIAYRFCIFIPFMNKFF